MDEAAIAIIRIRVERANEELRATQQLIASGLYRIACSRAYYAVFLIATAALLTLDVVRARHSGVEAAFHEQFIRGGRIEPGYGQLYTLLRKTREDSDYNDRAFVVEEMARQRLMDAERFVIRLEQYLREEKAIE
jgi:uncharacterized protein (UPF0332 family)